MKLFIRRLISDTNIHSASRVFIAMAITFVPNLLNITIPFFTQNNIYISTSMCLGVMASANVETDDNASSKSKFICLITICFFLTSLLVKLFIDTPILLGLTILLISFTCIMLTNLGTHYNKLGFGAILIAIYTMVGHDPNIVFYEQPLLFTIGVLWYGLFSLVWDRFFPYRSLHEQLAQLYFSISRYQETKTLLFNEQSLASQKGFFNARQKLAIKNVAIMGRFAIAKEIICSRIDDKKKQPELERLTHYYLTAEQIHERISASQYLYSKLEDTFKKSQILEGFHQTLHQLSEASFKLGTSINEEKTYVHPRRLLWTINALGDQLYLLKQKCKLFDQNKDAIRALDAIYQNLRSINDLMQSIDKKRENSGVIPKFIVDKDREKNFSQKIKYYFNPNNFIFKHAVRISVSLLIGIIIKEVFHFEQGFWILLTVLFVCQPSFSETKKRLVSRSIGTLTGILLGFPILILVQAQWLQILLLLLSAFFFFSYLRTNYGLAVVFITLFVIFLFDLVTGNADHILSSRIIETLIGCFISVFAISFIFPDWQFTRFPKLASKLLKLSTHYFDEVSSQFEIPFNENMKYRNIRYKIFSSDAALTSAWQNMLFEPNSKQKQLHEFYALANRCDALVAYIAALASNRHQIADPLQLSKLQDLMKLTRSQLNQTQQLLPIDDQKLTFTLIEFEKTKDNLYDDGILIAEQLELIASTAFDIQVILLNIKEQNNNIQSS